MGVGESEKRSPYALGRELELLGDRTRALAALDMLLSTPEWIHRRIEQVQLTTARHFERRVSIDFTSPNPDRTTTNWLGDDPVAFVPVDVLAKRPLTAFSIGLADGTAIPTLTRRQNGELMYAGLLALANDVLSASGLAQLPQEQAAALRLVVQGHPLASTRQLHWLRTWSAAEPRRDAALNRAGFFATAEMLARNFVLIGMVPAAPGARRVLKYCCEGSLGDSADRREVAARFKESIGWQPTTLEFDAPSYADCETYHFEVTAPDGIELIDIVLGEEGDGRATDVADRSRARGYSRVLEASPHRAHLSTSRTSDPDNPDDQIRVPRVSVRIRAERTSWIRSSAIAAVFVSFVLCASTPFVWLMDEPSTEVTEAEVVSSAGWWNGSAALNADPAAFAVALLSVISLAVIRVGEHAYTAQLLRKLRLLALLSAVLPIFGAWLLVFPGPGRLLELGWAGLAALSVLIAAVLVAVWRRQPGARSIDNAATIGTRQ